MSISKDIETKMKSLLSQEIEEVTSNGVVGRNNKIVKKFGKTKSFDGYVLFVDLRGSSMILDKKNRKAVVKLHRAYFSILEKVVAHNGGVIRSTDGDSILCFFSKTTSDSRKSAITSAKQIKYYLKDSDESLYNHAKSNYDVDIDFGIGISYGHILVARVFETVNFEYMWIDEAVNKTAKISSSLRTPDCIVITEEVYRTLPDNEKGCWTLSEIDYNYNKLKLYITDESEEISDEN